MLLRLRFTRIKGLCREAVLPETADAKRRCDHPLPKGKLGDSLPVRKIIGSEGHLPMKIGVWWWEDGGGRICTFAYFPCRAEAAVSVNHCLKVRVALKDGSFGG